MNVVSDFHTQQTLLCLFNMMDSFFLSFISLLLFFFFFFLSCLFVCFGFVVVLGGKSRQYFSIFVLRLSCFVVNVDPSSCIRALC